MVVHIYVVKILNGVVLQQYIRLINFANQIHTYVCMFVLFVRSPSAHSRLTVSSLYGYLRSPHRFVRAYRSQSAQFAPSVRTQSV